MQNRLMILSIASALLVSASPVGAQQPQGVPGMFGPRVLGHTLRPMPRTQSGFSRGGIAYGRSGQFYGIDADHEALMFRGSSWQYRPREIPLPRVGRLPLWTVLPGVPEQYELPPTNEPRPEFQQREIPLPPDEQVPGEEIPGGPPAP
jgi:hypothetical protein